MHERGGRLFVVVAAGVGGSVRVREEEGWCLTMGAPVEADA